MDEKTLISSGARAIRSLAPSVSGLEDVDAARALATRVVQRGHFTPEEDASLWAWYARYLTARAGLLEVIDDLAPIARDTQRREDEMTLRAFVIAYTAAAMLVRAGRFLIFDFAQEKIIQRKLNEASIDHRVPRKQYTRIYRALTSPVHAYRLNEAATFADENRAAIEGLATDPEMAPVVAYLLEAEPSLRIGVRTLVKARLRYRWHSWRRRRSSAVKLGIFKVAEAFGRIVADISNPWHESRVTSDVRAEVESLLNPGDVIVARHDDALSNLFLPGYWPHAALHIGTEATRRELAVDIPTEQGNRWVDPRRVLEARKDGVLFRPLEDTLDVDAFAIIRPQIEPTEISLALTQAVRHEGKLYNFDFDFFTADRLVCTEVVYRAFEGIGGLSFELVRRAGRLTLSAEDLLDMAVDDRGFETVALYGTPNIGDRLLTGGAAADALVKSYRTIGA